jgi:hypothetical protein
MRDFLQKYHSHRGSGQDCASLATVDLFFGKGCFFRGFGLELKAFSTLLHLFLSCFPLFNRLRGFINRPYNYTYIEQSEGV